MYFVISSIEQIDIKLVNNKLVYVWAYASKQLSSRFATNLYCQRQEVSARLERWPPRNIFHYINHNFISSRSDAEERGVFEMALRDPARYTATKDSEIQLGVDGTQRLILFLNIQFLVHNSLH